jgi:hypothetical protein
MKARSRQNTAIRGRRPSRYVGVHLDGRSWSAQICIARKRFFLGNWRTEREAAEAYDRAALYYPKSGVALNFPDRLLAPADEATLRREARIRRAKKTTSGFFGVTRSKARWSARIYVGGRARTLGCWATEAEAAEAHDRAARLLFYPKARLNFPERHLKPRAPAELLQAAGRARKSSASSRYARVYLAAGYQRRPWIAQIRLPRKGVVHLGTWESEDDAARAHDRAARFYFGAAAKVNLRDERLRPADAATLVAEARREIKRRRSSRYLGVSWQTRGQNWRATIEHRGRHLQLGTFRDERNAALAYDAKSMELRGDLARVNFDPVSGKPVWGKRIVDL